MFSAAVELTRKWRDCGGRGGRASVSRGVPDRRPVFLGWTEEELEYYERHQTLPTATERRRLLIVG
jgi:hypothetical protein